MSENKNFIDKMFDGAEAIVGGIEKSKEFADPLPDDETTDAEFVSKKPDIVWGQDKEGMSFHIFKGFQTIALCNRHFDANQLGSRRTEMEDGNFKCCGGCLRALQRL